jgi:hypothetical protein
MQRIVYTAIMPETLFATKPVLVLTEIEELEKKLHRATSELRVLYHTKNNDLKKQQAAETLVNQFMFEIKKKTTVSDARPVP